MYIYVSLGVVKIWLFVPFLIIGKFWYILRWLSEIQTHNTLNQPQNTQ